MVVDNEVCRWIIGGEIGFAVFPGGRNFLEIPVKGQEL
jgi:hypothetical protein